MSLTNALRSFLASSLLISLPAIAADLTIADDMHPLMNDKYWVNVGVLFAARDLDISVDGSLGPMMLDLDLDFESSVGLDDTPDLLTTEFGWQFSDDWGLSLQFFRSERSVNETLQKTIEWEDLTFEAGIDFSAASKVSVTRLFFSRRFWDGGRHSLRLGAGIHLLEAAVRIGGQARLDDMTTEYRTSAKSASFPVPNIGAWYRYSPSNRWLFSARVDWFGASLGDFSGEVLNGTAGANFLLSEHFGIGINYQLFQIDGRIRETHWRGSLRTRLTGPNLHITAHW